ncbi:MAG: Cu(I)-responsive transcriptional regulator [Pseudomonadota bacterium]
MNIGEAAKRSGVNSKMIRYYESIGLTEAAIRQESGYRDYSDNDVHALRFIRRARDLGFSVKQIGDLLALWRDRDRSSADVKAISLQHVRDLQDKRRAIEDMIATLSNLAQHCHGDGRPDCPIIANLADADVEAREPQAKSRPSAAPIAPLERGHPGRTSARRA